MGQAGGRRKGEDIEGDGSILLQVALQQLGKPALRLQLLLEAGLGRSSIGLRLAKLVLQRRLALLELLNTLLQ